MKHNKKRNVGLLYEFLARHAAEGVVNGDQQQVKRSVKLLRKHFSDGTELHKEFRLFRALVGAAVDSKETAHRIIETSKRAARAYDREKLDHEKSLLIRGINHTFNDEAFYDKRVDEYKLYATVQTLLNEWRQDVPSDIAEIARYEGDLIEHLVKPKQKNVLDESRRDNVDDLFVRLMMRKVDGKYKGLLNDEQIALMNSYVYSVQTGRADGVHEAIEKLRKDTLVAIDGYAQEEKDNHVITEKLAEIRGLLAEQVGSVDDRVLAHYLRIARLKQEILGS